MKYTPDGKFRRFAFIGYQTEESAQEAITYFNNSRIDTSKVSVQLCSLLGDENKPKPWSKYSEESTIYKKSNEDNDIKEVADVAVKENNYSDKAKELLRKVFVQFPISHSLLRFIDL